MITALKSVLMCRDFQRDDNGTNIIGLIGETLLAESTPGFVENWIVIAVDVDGRGGRGQVRLHAPSYAFAVPFEIPAGPEMTSFAFPILVPVLRPGTLHIEVTDDARRGKPFSAKWKLGFYPDAQVVEETAGLSFVQSARENAEMLARNLSQQRTH
jgi:hypothetical protein